MSENKNLKMQALEYHAKNRPGKIEVIPSKEAKTQRDLSLAYTPGVAEPCKAIFKKPELVYDYTVKGNLVAVITNGTAVLGLGDIGPTASKPVMEGKGLLFKIFADIDVFDIEINEKDPDKFIEIVKSLEPTFGGINLEDIKAPECFYIEQKLKELMTIPVMHDDQHGTAIITGAALLNAVELQGKKIDQLKFVISGAGAAALSCCKLYLLLGALPQNFIIFDIDGVLYDGREDFSHDKLQFVRHQKNKHLTLREAMSNSDVFIGLSVGNIIDENMIKSMAHKPIVFALANPDPEISYDRAASTRDDIIVATGRSDFPNQVNNVLGFPFIFRGALDVRATAINESMKLAAVHALANLAKTTVPDIVNLAYKEKNLSFGQQYIIPKPFDPRLISTVSPAVAKAAMQSGVAKKNISDWDEYEMQLKKRLGLDDQIMRALSIRAKRGPKRLVFADAENQKILKAASLLYEEGYAYPILLGDPKNINNIAQLNSIELFDIPIVNPRADTETATRNKYGAIFFEKRQRKGINSYESLKLMRDSTYFGCMMVEVGDADAVVSGLTRNYGDVILPAIQCIGMSDEVSRLAGMQVLLSKRGAIFLADTTVNYRPTAEELADITLRIAYHVKQFNVVPKIAMLSFSNFGSNRAPEAQLVAKAVRIIREKDPSLIIDGEMQGTFALNKELLKENYPFSSLVGQDVNTLIFPNLDAGNIAYTLLRDLGNIEIIGPILLGLKKPMHIINLGSTVRNIINISLIAISDAQIKSNSITLERSEYQKDWWQQLGGK
ncbi:MAG: NADP-dependent malic enzyme [Phycisphaerales bacterium]|nr:NADP-dependent malic enzyme [Phycisphaerales bacterium]